MLKKVLLFFFWGLFTPLHGTNLDSLYQILSNSEGISRVDILLDISNLELPKKGIILAKEAEALSKEIGDDIGKIDALLMLSSLNYDLGKFDLSEVYCKQAIKACQELGNLAKEIDAYYSLANLYLDSDKHKKSLETIYKGLILATQYKEEDMIAYGELKLASFLYSLENYEKAEALGLKSYKYFKKKKDKVNISHASYALGNNFIQRGNFEAAQRFLGETLALATELSDLPMIRISNGALADLYLEKEAHEAAIPYLEEAMRLSLAVEDPLEIAVNKLGFAEIAFAKRNKEKGIELVNEALSMVDSLDLMEIKESAYGLLYIHYKEIGDTKNALLYTRKVEEIEDSLNALGMMSQLVDFEVKKVIKEKEVQLWQIEKQTMLQRYIFIGIVGLLIISVYYVWKKRAKKEQLGVFIKVCQK